MRKRALLPTASKTLVEILTCHVARCAVDWTPMQAIEESCCDDADSCTSGAPTVCSPTCAVTFLPYFAQCAQAVWGAQPTFQASMQIFHDTCMRG